MTWKPPLYEIISGLVDVRKLDDEQIAFVRANIERLGKQKMEVDDLEYQLRAMASMRRGLTADLLIMGSDISYFVITLRDDVVTVHPARNVPGLADSLVNRHRIDYRLPGEHYTLERLAEVEALAKRRNAADAPELIRYLRVANQPTPSEENLRLAVFDALAWHQTLPVREFLLEALETEPDFVAELLISVMHRQPYILEELPQRITEAWRAKNHRFARRMLAALIKNDDDRKHVAWAEESFPSLVRELT